MDRLDRAATAAETAKMREMARESLASGAIGVSTGRPTPGRSGPHRGVDRSMPPAHRIRRTLRHHMRNEDDRITESMDETFLIGRTLDVPVVISHHKCVGTRNHGRSPETLALIEQAMRNQKVGLDCYPYIASSTVLRYDRLEQSSKILITWSKPHPEFSGLDLEEVARRWGCREPTPSRRSSPRARSISCSTRKTCSVSWRSTRP